MWVWKPCFCKMSSFLGALRLLPSLHIPEPVLGSLSVALGRPFWARSRQGCCRPRQEGWGGPPCPAMLVDVWAFFPTALPTEHASALLRPGGSGHQGGSPPASGAHRHQAHRLLPYGPLGTGLRLWARETLWSPNLPPYPKGGGEREPRRWWGREGNPAQLSRGRQEFPELAGL